MSVYVHRELCGGSACRWQCSSLQGCREQRGSTTPHSWPDPELAVSRRALMLSAARTLALAPAASHPGPMCTTVNLRGEAVIGCALVEPSSATVPASAAAASADAWAACAWRAAGVSDLHSASGLSLCKPDLQLPHASDAC